MAHYAGLAIAPSTRRAYSHGVRRYLSFCDLCRCQSLPATDAVLSSFAAHLAESLKPLTICNYVAAVRNYHLECGHPDPTEHATLLPRVLKLRSLLLSAGISNAKDHAGHSFRIGAATSAAACRIPDWQIRILGRWQSDSMLCYIRTHSAELASVARTLAEAPI